VSRYLQANTKNRKVYGQKSGTLSNKNLHRLKMKGVGELRQRVFHKRVLNKSKDVAITVLVDLSGSMSTYSKSDAAIAAVTHLHEVLHKQLHIPLEILGFSETIPDQYEYKQHGIMVTFQQFGKPRTNEQIEHGMRRLMAFNGCNRDGEALMFARNRLLRQKAGRRIMLVISDGQPRAGGGGDVAAFTKQVIDKILAEGAIDLYAIGLKSTNVRHFYPQYQIVNEPDQLESALLTVLRDKILDEVTA
jgi:cobalamin biosynthesis protein CobT